ncbi:MAG: DUF1684 domain-containing protein [Anaerolineales bacterium]
MGAGSLALLDYRRQVAAHYRDVRESTASPEDRWLRWRRQRDLLFQGHSQSPLNESDAASFNGLSYFDFNPELRFEVEIERVEGDELQVDLAQDGLLHLQPLGRVAFRLDDEAARLMVYWLTGYGGGLFLPFRDRTNGKGSYAGGRYLLDTVKGADLGGSEDRLILDFNYAYNPSCAYDDHWHCPLPPADNWLEYEIQAGEKDFNGGRVEEPDPTAIPRPAGKDPD